MNRHLHDMTEKCPGLQRPCDAIATREERTRAHGVEEIF